MRQLRNLAMAILLSTTGILMSSTPAWAGKAGVVTHLSGVLNVTRLDGTSKIISVKSEVMEGDTLRTEIDTFARIKFNDGGEVVLRPESILKLDNYAYDAAQKGQDNFMASLLKGGLRSVTGLLGKRNPDRFKLNTSAATIGIRGTHFGAVICNNDCANIPTVTGQAPGNGLYTDTAQGATVVTNAAGSVVVPAGSFSYTPSVNVSPQLVPPTLGIQVTMPTSISSNKSSGSGLGQGNSNSCTVK